MEHKNKKHMQKRETTTAPGLRDELRSADNKGNTRTIYKGVKVLGDSESFEHTKPTEHMTQKKKNLKMTNENGSTSANGETEMPESSAANENAENEMSIDNPTTNKKKRTWETEN